MQKNHKVVKNSKLNWENESDSELKADFKSELNFKLLMFIKINFKSKPPA